MSKDASQSSNKSERRLENELPQVLTTSDLLEVLPFGRSKVYSLLRRGEIPSKKVDGQFLVPRDLFLDWLRDVNGGGRDDSSKASLRLIC